MLEAQQSPGRILSELWRAWAQRDKRAVLSLCSEHIVFSIYVPEHVLAFGGVTTGKPSVSDRLQTILDQFDTPRYEGAVHGTDGDTVHGIVDYCFRHRATGESIEGQMRHVAVVRDGLIVDLKEFHDLSRVTAFMRLIAEVARRP